MMVAMLPMFRWMQFCFIVTASLSCHATENHFSHIVDVSIQANLDTWHVHTSEALYDLTESLGAGGCVFDMDNDGWVDILLLPGLGHTRFNGKRSWWDANVRGVLYKNMSTQSSIFFKDVTKESGLTHAAKAMACSTGDLDRDGDEDVLLTGYGFMSLYENQGGEGFKEHSIYEQLKTGPFPLWGTGASIVDVDQDGWLDIYITNYIDFKKRARIFEGLSGYNLGVNQFVSDNYNSQANIFLKNTGHPAKQELKQSMGFSNTSFLPESDFLGISNNDGRSLFSLWHDFNNDHRLDLIVMNDSGSPSSLYINQGRRFEIVRGGIKIGSEAGLHSGIVNIADDGAIYHLSSSGMGRGLIYENTGDHNELSVHNFVSSSYSWLNTWGMAQIDTMNTGDPDIYMANGLLTPALDSNHVPQGQLQTKLIWSESNDSYLIEVIDYNSIYSARSILRGDWNNDGKIDFLYINNNGPVKIFQNKSENNNGSVTLLLINKYGYISQSGVKLYYEVNGKKKFLMPSRQAFMGQHSPYIHLGAGDNQYIKNLKIEWQDGDVQRVGDVQVGKWLKITQGKQASSIFIAKNDSLKGLDLIDASVSAVKMMIEIDDPRYNSKIIELYEKLSEINKINILEWLLENPNSYIEASLLIAQSALMSDETEALHGIQILNNLEHARSLPWLIAALKNDSDNIVCAAASVFSGYYREEEALIYQKWLSIPIIINIINKEKSTRKLSCLIKTLNESDSYRAYLLGRSLVGHSSLEVRLSAVELLGNTTEKDAVVLLQGIMGDDGSPVILRAAAFRSLLRLGTNNTGVQSVNEFYDLFTREKDYATQLKRLAIVSQYFLGSSDIYSTFSEYDIYESIMDIVDVPERDFIQSSKLRLELIRLLGYIPTDQSKKMLSSYFQGDDKYSVIQSALSLDKMQPGSHVLESLLMSSIGKLEQVNPDVFYGVGFKFSNSASSKLVDEIRDLISWLPVLATGELINLVNQYGFESELRQSIYLELASRDDYVPGVLGSKLILNDKSMTDDLYKILFIKIVEHHPQYIIWAVKKELRPSVLKPLVAYYSSLNVIRDNWQDIVNYLSGNHVAVFLDNLIEIDIMSDLTKKERTDISDYLWSIIIDETLVAEVRYKASRVLIGSELQDLKRYWKIQ